MNDQKIEQFILTVTVVNGKVTQIFAIDAGVTKSHRNVCEVFPQPGPIPPPHKLECSKAAKDALTKYVESKFNVTK